VVFKYVDEIVMKY